MDLYQADIPPPRDWQELQRISKDFYKEKYPECVVDEYGSQGQVQHGVDTYIYSASEQIGIQCKRVKKFNVANLKAELDKTANFPKELKHYVVIVTIDHDIALQDAAASFTLEKGFLIEVKFWKGLAEEVASSEVLAKKHFKFAARYAVMVEADPSSALVELTGHESCYRFVVTKMAVFDKYKGDNDLLLVSSLQAQKRATFHRLNGGYWTDFEGVIGCGAFDAYLAWCWFSQFNSFESICKTSGKAQEICISEQRRRDFVEQFCGNDDA
jgi:hypothetical protein